VGLFGILVSLLLPPPTSVILAYNCNHSNDYFRLSYKYESRIQFSSCEMEPAGISTQFDWACLVPCMFGNPHRAPSTVFVSTFMLPHFVEHTLNNMDPRYRFVLISGGEDLTVPRSVDVRFPKLRGFADSPDGGEYYQRLLNDPRIIHWFCENHDMVHPKISTLPTG